MNLPCDNCEGKSADLRYRKRLDERILARIEEQRRRWRRRNRAGRKLRNGQPPPDGLVCKTRLKMRPFPGRFAPHAYKRSAKNLEGSIQK